MHMGSNQLKTSQRPKRDASVSPFKAEMGLSLQCSPQLLRRLVPNLFASKPVLRVLSTVINRFSASENSPTTPREHPHVLFHTANQWLVSAMTVHKTNLYNGCPISLLFQCHHFFMAAANRSTRRTRCLVPAAGVDHSQHCRAPTG